MHRVYHVLGLLLVFTVFALLVAWVQISREPFSGRVLSAGERYAVGSRTYRLPNLPIKGVAYMMKEGFLLKMRSLLQRTHALLGAVGVKYWISGGTLISFTLNKTFSPWDDDIDLHTLFENRDYLSTCEFGREAEKFGLSAIYLRFYSTRFATKESSAVRLRLTGSQTPVLDIFFSADRGDGHMVKLDGWKNRTTPIFSTKEIFPKECVFPLRKRVVDDMEMYLPNQPEKMVQIQYGKNCLKRLVSRHHMISHETPYVLLPWVWTKRSHKLSEHA